MSLTEIITKTTHNGGERTTLDRGVRRQLHDPANRRRMDEPEGVEPEEFEDEPEPPPQAPSATDRGSQKRIRDRVKREAAERKTFWAGALATEVGRRELYWLLDKMHYDRERFCVADNGAPYSEATWAETGVQRIGFQLFRLWLGLSPEGVLTMLREHDPTLKPPEKPRRRRRSEQEI